MGNDRSAAGAANAAGRAASAAVTPGDQNMGRNPDNRSGGVMGSDRGTTGSGALGSGTTGSGTTEGRAARPDRG